VLSHVFGIKFSFIQVKFISNARILIVLISRFFPI
jgi:hypothetical protein